MKKLTLIILLSMPTLVLAAGGAHHGEGIPKSVIYQLINVAILVAGLIYFTKDSIVEFFSGRKTAYLDAAQKSAFAREEAEKQFVDIKNRLEQLTSTRSDAIKKAEVHAEDLKKQILAEAAEVSKRIRDEAELTAKLEIRRAQKELREELVKDSVEAARIVLTKDIGGSDQQKLQTDFIKNIEVVSR